MWVSGMRRMLLWGLACVLILFLTGLRNLLTGDSIVFAILYWYVAFVALPKWYGYRVEEEVEVLSDGTSITKLVNVKND